MPRHLGSWLLAALAVASMIVLVPVCATADLIASAPATAPATAAPAAQAPADGPVVDALRTQGLTDAEIAARMSELNEQDLSVLEGAPEQVQFAAGTDFLVVGVILAAVLIVALFYYLID